MDKQAPLSEEKRRLLALRLKGSAHAPAESRAIPGRAAGRHPALSAAQHQMWIIEQMNPGNPAYHIPVAYRLIGELEVGALQESFNEIIRRHEVWRTTFREIGGNPVQEIHAVCAIQIGVTDLAHLPAGSREHELRTLAAEEAVKPFDLHALPLLRVSLFRLGENDHVLLVNVHHIVADGLSLNLMFAELDAIYRAAVAGTAHRLPEMIAQYADFAAWQAAELSDGRHARQLEFWRGHLQGSLPPLQIATDTPRPARQSFHGSAVSLEIPRPLAQALAAIGSGERCTFFVTILAAFQVLLMRYSRAAEIVIGTPVASRPLPEFEKLIGNFLNIVALRCDLSGDPSFTELLRKSRETTLHALSNADVPFETVVKGLATHRDPSRNPVFQALMQILPPVRARIGELSVSRFDFEMRFAQVDIALHLYEEPEGDFSGHVQYCTDLFCAETIGRLSRNFVRLLHGIASDPRARIGKIPILEDAEKNRLLREWNRTALVHPGDASVHALIAQQAGRTPDSVAVEAGDQRLTYGELDRRANRIAQHLRALGAAPGALIGVCVERSAEMVAAVLGILKSGAAYVPLDPAFPAARIAMMIEDAAMPIIVTQRSLASALPPHRAVVVLLEDVKHATNDPAPQQAASTPDDLAYVIFTSGSTGRPKGVEITHHALANFLHSMRRSPGMTGDDVLLAVTTLSFDIAGLEIFLPLICGARLVMLTRETAMDGHALLGEIERRRATLLQATPATWRLLLETKWTGTPGLKALIGGEACPRELAAQLLPKCGELWNMYGPTETTIWSTIQKLTAHDTVIAIGRPIANTRIYILDAQLEPVPIGVPGELHIGGAGLARGYLHRPELTAEKFIRDPFSADAADRLYRTGDLARHLSDGRIECLGRMDQQVKLRGFRIEPGEIEAALRQHPSVAEAAVIAREDSPGEKRLVAYLVSAQQPPCSVADLRAHLKTRLPDYMVPTAFAFLDALPLTANGKVDRRALPIPEPGRGNPADAFVAPRTDLERRVSAIWRELLKADRVGIHDDFFELGGDSLAAMQVVSRLRGPQFPDLNVLRIFERPTVAEFVKSWPVANADAAREEGVL